MKRKEKKHRKRKKEKPKGKRKERERKRERKRKHNINRKRNGGKGKEQQEEEEEEEKERSRHREPQRAMESNKGRPRESGECTKINDGKEAGWTRYPGGAICRSAPDARTEFKANDPERIRESRIRVPSQDVALPFKTNLP